MRITQNYSINSLLRQVNLTRERINVYQRNLATGKRINRISDDPENIETVIRYKRMIKFNERFQNTIGSALDFMYFTSETLDQSANVIARVKELTIQGADSLNADEFKAFEQQIDQLLRKLVNLGNTKFKDRYIFGGANTDKPPFTLAPDGSSVTANPDGIDGALKAEIGDGKVEQYNISGEQVFNSDVDIFGTLIALRDAFANQDTATISNLIPDLETALDQITEANATLGAKIKRFELIDEQYRNENLRLQEFLSKTEDTDMAKTITDLQMEQTALETALRALAKTVNISLVDFM